MNNDVIQQLATTLEQRGGELADKRVVAGFDGFVDEMIQVVGERKDLNTFEALSQISGFGEWVSNAAGRSSLKEIVVNRQEAGGCAVNLGDGIVGMGIKLDCYATLGNPIAAPFAQFASKCQYVESWCSQPGRTLAFEFDDGKLMFSSVSQLGELSADYVQKAIDEGKILQSCQQAELIAITNWTLYPHMTACWQVFQREVLAKCSYKPYIFVDLVDPRSRSEEDIRAMLNTLSTFANHARPVLGLNINEANAVAKLFGIDAVDDDGEAMTKQAAAIREALGIEQVVIHAIKVAAMASKNASAIATGPFCPKPLKSVGAGDRFNAGYCAALLLGLEPQQCLLLGNVSSGYFVRKAQSGSVEELAAFTQQWAAGTICD